MYKNLIILEHPLINSYITRIRDKNTSFIDFRFCVDKLSLMLAYEAGRELSSINKKIQTPLKKFNGKKINNKIIIVPILRAGLGLLGGFNEMYPEAIISHIGIYRNENTLKPIKYYFNFPKIQNLRSVIVFIIDPMLATGGSGICTIDELKKKGINKIIIASLVAAPEGIRAIEHKHKNVKIYTCALDSHLNSSGYIVPGLGDAGDRLFGT